MPMLTFWKRERLELLREKSANRTVTTVFRRPGATELFAVVNCHLSAGDAGGAPRKRFQQLEQGLYAATISIAAIWVAFFSTSKRYRGGQRHGAEGARECCRRAERQATAQEEESGRRRAAGRGVRRG